MYETLFTVFNVAVVPAWLLLIFAPYATSHLH